MFRIFFLVLVLTLLSVPANAVIERKISYVSGGNILTATYTNTDIYTGFSAITETIMTDGGYDTTSNSTATNADGEIIMDFGSNQSVKGIWASPSTVSGWGDLFVNNRIIDYSTTSTCASNPAGATWTDVVNLTSGHVDGSIKEYTVSITARCVRIQRDGGYFVALGDFYSTD